MCCDNWSSSITNLKKNQSKKNNFTFVFWYVLIIFLLWIKKMIIKKENAFIFILNVLQGEVF